MQSYTKVSVSASREQTEGTQIADTGSCHIQKHTIGPSSSIFSEPAGSSSPGFPAGCIPSAALRYQALYLGDSVCKVDVVPLSYSLFQEQVLSMRPRAVGELSSRN